jgi:hypothetical protein
MSTIVSLINSSNLKVNPRLVFDDTHAFLTSPDKNAYLAKLGITVTAALRMAIDLYDLMDKIAPVTLEQSYNVASLKIKRNMSIASLTGLDQPIAMTGAGAIETALTNLFKITIGVNFNEAEQIQFQTLLETGIIPANYLDWIVKNVDDLQPKIWRLTVLLTAQVLRMGRVNWTDPRTGNQGRMDYNFIPELFPPPLTGIRAWNQPATATGIADIIYHSDRYYYHNGFRPQYIVMRTETMRELSAQQSTIQYLISLGLVNAQTTGGTFVSLGRLQEIFKALQLPEIWIWDAQVEIESAPGLLQRINVMNTGEYFFAQSGMGERIFGKTIESKGKTGIFVDTDPKDRKSTEDQAIAIARFVPFIENPKLLAAWVVN